MRSAVLALPLDPWCCVECLTDLRDQPHVSTLVSEFYEGEGEPPIYVVRFCDAECGYSWWCKGRTREGIEW